MNGWFAGFRRTSLRVKFLGDRLGRLLQLLKKSRGDSEKVDTGKGFDFTDLQGMNLVRI